MRDDVAETQGIVGPEVIEPPLAELLGAAAFAESRERHHRLVDP